MRQPTPTSTETAKEYVMGRKTVELRITASLSNHNDEQDQTDRKLWTSLVAEVRKVVARFEADHDLDVHGTDEDL